MTYQKTVYTPCTYNYLNQSTRSTYSWRAKTSLTSVRELLMQCMQGRASKNFFSFVLALFMTSSARLSWPTRIGMILLQIWLSSAQTHASSHTTGNTSGNNCRRFAKSAEYHSLLSTAMYPPGSERRSSKAFRTGKYKCSPAIRKRLAMALRLQQARQQYGARQHTTQSTFNSSIGAFTVLGKLKRLKPFSYLRR